MTNSPSLGVSLKPPSMSSITILGIVAVLLLVLVFSLWQWKKWRQSKKRIVEGREIMMSKKLSEGGFSQVFGATTLAGEQMVLKQMISNCKETEERIQLEIQRLRSLTALNHTNILPLIGASAQAHPSLAGALEFNLLFPLCPGGSCYDRLLRAEQEGGQWPYPEAHALTVFSEVCAGVATMHEWGLLHLDIKPANVLFKYDHTQQRSVAVLIDIGSAAPAEIIVADRASALQLQEEAEQHCSAAFRAPELWDVPVHSVIGPSSDVWSLGCFLYALAFGRSPFESRTEGLLKLSILSANLSRCWPSGMSNVAGVAYSARLRNLVERILVRDAMSRPSLSALSHEVQMLIQNTPN